jgi:hypothetical protein
LYTCTGLDVKQLGLCFRTRRRRAVSKRQEHTKKTTKKEMMEDKKGKARRREKRKYFIVTVKLSVAMYFEVQIHHSFIQRPHSEILIHFRIKVVDSTLLHQVTPISLLLHTKDAPFTPMKENPAILHPKVWIK